MTKTHKYMKNEFYQSQKNKKKSLRTYMRTIRQSLTVTTQYISAQLITKRVLSSHHILKSTNIGIYYDFDGEIKTTLLIQALLLMNKKIYLPTISHTKSKKLLFKEYTFFTPLRLNKFNIYEPKLTKYSAIPISTLDIIFVPLVAFDNYGNRLGMGYGFYDKTLQKNKSQKKPIIIGLAHDFQKIPAQLLPIESWDIKLSEIFTPSYHWNWIIKK